MAGTENYQRRTDGSGLILLQSALGHTIITDHRGGAHVYRGGALGLRDISSAGPFFVPLSVAVFMTVTLLGAEALIIVPYTDACPAL
jgi:hypothetical protein